MKIGLTYIKGSLPGFEDFGNLPTNFVKSNGFVDGTNGVKASDELDGIIIPGGSILESNSISNDLANEIKTMACDGKIVIGICSGFQALANQTDVGRKSPCPIIKKGLGLLDVNFSPLISNDRVEAKIADNTKFSTDSSFFIKNISSSDVITGFHCHTYGNIEINNDNKDNNNYDNDYGDSDNVFPILYSSIKRMNYSDTKSNVLSGVSNEDGNVIGTMIHGILDENPLIVENIFEYLGADFNDINNIFIANEKVKKRIKSELAIDTGIDIKNIKYCNEFKKMLLSSLNNKNKENQRFSSSSKMNNKNKSLTHDIDSVSYGTPPMLMIGGTSSDSGKTFITTGIAGALTKRGLNVCVLKVGPDLRDTEPSLYLTKNKMEEYGSIKIGHLGWMDIENTLKRLKSSNYDFVIVEGVMSVFTGLLNGKIPYSGAEIAYSSNIPILLVSGVSKGGIESAALDVVSSAKTLEKMGIDVNGIIFNKVYDMDIFNKVADYVATNSRDSLSKDDILAVPKVKLDERSTTPEVEIKLEEFSKAALDTVEKYLDLEKIVKMSNIPEFKRYLTFDEIKRLFS